jgi:hypothetical protein
MNGEICIPEYVKKGQTLIESWLSVEQYLQSKKTMFPKVNDQAGPIAIAINLGSVPVASVHELFQKSPDEIKTHPGVRTTFLIAKFLYAGWSSVAEKGSSTDSSTNSSNGKRNAPGGYHKKGGKDNANGNQPEKKEKLSHMLGNHVILHSFDLVNQRGTYVRNGKSEECCVLSPGMLLTSKVWGNKFGKTFKDQESDIHPFDIVLVEFGMHSIGSTAKENGSMLEIKTYKSMPMLNISAFHLFSSTLFPSTVQESSFLKTQFSSASHVLNNSFLKPFQNCPLVQTISNQFETSDDVSGNQNADNVQDFTIRGVTQDMIRMNISTSNFLVKVTPKYSNGFFAISADDSICFHVHQPMADIPCASGVMKIQYFPEDFIANPHKLYETDPDFPSSSLFKDWLVKMFNVFVMLGGIELIVLIDTYKKKQQPGTDENADSMTVQEVLQSGQGQSLSSNLILQAYCRINVHNVTEQLCQKKPVPIENFDFIAKYFLGQDMASSMKHLVVYNLNSTSQGDAPIQIVLDSRKITKKSNSTAFMTATVSSSTLCMNTLWEKGNVAYVFSENKMIHYFLIPSFLNQAPGSDSTKMQMDTISISSVMKQNDIQFEEDEESSVENSSSNTNPPLDTMMEASPSTSEDNIPKSSKKAKKEMK